MKKGDIVKVKDWGEGYSDNGGWYTDKQLPKFKAGYYGKEDPYPRYEVIRTDAKDGGEDKVIAIEDSDGNQYVINGKGVTLVKQNMKNTYKTGDIIIGRHNAPYQYTGAGTVCLVKSVNKNSISVRPYNPVEGKEMTLTENGAKVGDLEVDPQHFLPLYGKEKNIDKKWGKLGNLLIKAIELIKKMLKMLMRKKVTQVEKDLMKKAVTKYFQLVKKELAGKGEKDEAQEKKSEEQKTPTGKDEEEEQETPSKESEELDKIVEELERQEQIAKSEQFKEKYADKFEPVEKKSKQEEEEKEIDWDKVEEQVATKSKGHNGSGQRQEEPEKGKVFCGVCNKYHTKGTHD